TAKATLDKLTSVCLAACAVDLDQDSDLDLLLCEFAPTPEQAVKLPQGEKTTSGGGLVAYLHVGAAPEVQNPTDKSPPLRCQFEKASLPALQGPASPRTILAASDMDGDRDLDFLVL